MLHLIRLSSYQGYNINIFDLILVSCPTQTLHLLSSKHAIDNYVKCSDFIFIFCISLHF